MPTYHQSDLVQAVQTLSMSYSLTGSHASNKRQINQVQSKNYLKEHLTEHLPARNWLSVIGIFPIHCSRNEWKTCKQFTKGVSSQASRICHVSEAKIGAGNHLEAPSQFRRKFFSGSEWIRNVNMVKQRSPHVHLPGAKSSAGESCET